MAAALAVAPRTYANYERGERLPDAEALARLVHEGWNANWVLTGAGDEHLSARQYLQAHFVRWAADQFTLTPHVAAGMFANDYGRGHVGTFKTPVPDWVRAQVPKLTLEEALALPDSEPDVADNRAPPASHPLSDDNLTIAIEFADRCVGDGWLPRPLYAKLVRLLYEGVTQGLPVADVLQIGKRVSQAMAQGETIDDGEHEVGAAGRKRSG